MNLKGSQIIKGIAILMVMLFHAQYGIYGGTFLAQRGQGVGDWVSNSVSYLGQNPDAWWAVIGSFGFVGVQIFLVLSGYGLTIKYLKMPRFEVKTWLKQMWKILLPYWIAMPVTHIINWAVSNLLLAAGKVEAVPEFFGIYYPMQYLESFFVPTRWFSDSLALNFVGTWWFVGMIMQFYLVLPLLIWLIKKIKPAQFLLFSIILTLVYRAIVVLTTDATPIGLNMAKPLLFINVPAQLAVFALGMYFATRKRLTLFRHQTLAGFALTLLGLILSSYTWGLVVSDLLIAFGSLLSFGFLIKYSKKLIGTLFSFMGRWSYYIYLYHEPLLSMLIKLFFR